MVDFGKRPGDMFKDDYDADDSGVVDEVEALPDHAAHHEDTGDDELSVAGLSGELADAQPVKAHLLGSASHAADSLVNLNLKISDGDLDKTTDSRIPTAHKTSHQNGGTDEISVAALSGELADVQPPKAHDLAGAAHNADTLADLNAKVSDATLDDSGDTRTPAAHKASHQNGGGDEISVAGLSGELADVQPPKAHLLGSASHSADTLANLNAKVSDGDLDKTTDTRTPAAHKASHQDGGADEIAITGLVGKSLFVDRGDPNGWDWAVGDLTTDATWNELDCSSIVPAGATAIFFRCQLKHDSGTPSFVIRKKGRTYAYTTCWNRILVAGAYHSLSLFSACDTNRLCEYYGDNVTFAILNLVVTGWFLG